MQTTESDSKYNSLDKMNLYSIIKNINTEDKLVAKAVEKQLLHIEKLIAIIVEKMKKGGRLFYIGAGTSGRLGILDASECVPTFGVPSNLVIGIIAGGQNAITKPIEFAEDDTEQGWLDLKAFNINKKDVVVGIAASGTTPYVLSALEICNKKNITTGGISCNQNTPLSKIANYMVEVNVGPEFITGSTRMKSGTAQKMLLNMISTATMIKLGRVEGNSMVNMQLVNNKLTDRGVKMLMKKMKTTDYEKAKKILLKAKSVKKAMELF